MTNDTMVTVQGWLGNEPQQRLVAGTAVTNFRLGCTPRRFHRGRQEWVNGATQWYGVSAWRGLGEHCKRSLHRGDPVVVHGRLTQRTYEREGVEVTALEIEAIVVGHDLTWGVSTFGKTVGVPRREDQPEKPAEATVADPWATPGARPAAVAEVAGAA